MSPYNWSIYMTLIIMFLICIIIFNFFNSSKSFNNNKINKMELKSTSWKW
uniref:ATP synthase F0 subunit 8 n=1 Tax=Platypus cylindrus TaxID=298138 RepID=J9PGT5_9CUCU|nr:ATP synthase F0 subunit 8 [Platypus cylindrus]